MVDRAVLEATGLLLGCQASSISVSRLSIRQLQAVWSAVLLFKREVLSGYGI